MHCIRLSPLPFAQTNSAHPSPLGSGISDFDTDIDSEDLDRDSGWETVSNLPSDNDGDDGDEDYFTPAEDGARSVADSFVDESEAVSDEGGSEDRVWVGMAAGLGDGLWDTAASANQADDVISGLHGCFGGGDERRRGESGRSDDEFETSKRESRGTRCKASEMCSQRDCEENIIRVEECIKKSGIWKKATLANADRDIDAPSSSPSSIDSRSEHSDDATNGSELYLKMEELMSSLMQERRSSIFSMPNTPLNLTLSRSEEDDGEKFDSDDRSCPSSYTSTPTTEAQKEYPAIWTSQSVANARRHVSPLQNSDNPSAGPRRGCLLQTRPKSFRRQKRVSFQLDSSSYDTTDDENSSPLFPSRSPPERDFPLCGGIVENTTRRDAQCRSTDTSPSRSTSPLDGPTQSSEPISGCMSAEENTQTSDRVTHDEGYISSINPPHKYLRKDFHPARSLVNPTTFDRLIMETAPLLGLTEEELVAEVCSGEDEEVLGNEPNGRKRSSTGSQDAPRPHVTTRHIRIDSLADCSDKALVRPKLRSTNCWRRRQSGSKDLREEYGQGEATTPERKSEESDRSLTRTSQESYRVRQAVQRLEAATRALNEWHLAGRRASDESSRKTGSGGSSGEPNLVGSATQVKDAAGRGASLGPGYVEGLRSINGYSKKHRPPMKQPVKCSTAQTPARKSAEESTYRSVPRSMNSDTPTPEPNPIPPQKAVISCTESSIAQAISTVQSTKQNLSVVNIAGPPAAPIPGPRNFSRPFPRVALPSIINNIGSRTSTPKVEKPTSTSTKATAHAIRRPGTPYPYRRLFHSSYAETSRLQQSRHHAWTIRKRVMAQISSSTMSISRPESRVAVPSAPRSDPGAMREYWSSQAELLKKHDTSRKRMPVRVALPQSPCSSCSVTSSSLKSKTATARPVMRLFRRSYRRLYRVMARLPKPRECFGHKSGRLVLIKYPRALGRSYSRTADWTREDEEVQRVLFRGDSDDESKISMEIKVTYSA